MKEEFNYLEMEYQNKRLEKPIILCEGKYKDYQFYILNLGTHPCGYVEIPKEHILYEKDYFEIEEMEINVHGGITYTNYFLYGIDKKSWYIGWDYAHAFDYYGGYDDKIFTNGLNDNCKKWSTIEIIEEVKNVINQLKVIN